MTQKTDEKALVTPEQLRALASEASRVHLDSHKLSPTLLAAADTIVELRARIPETPKVPVAVAEIYRILESFPPQTRARLLNAVGILLLCDTEK